MTGYWQLEKKWKPSWLHVFLLLFSTSAFVQCGSTNPPCERGDFTCNPVLGTLLFLTPGPPCSLIIRGGTMQGCDLYLAGRVTTIAGNATAAYADGIGTAAAFNFPNQATTNGSLVFIGDATNNRVRQFDIASGSTTTLAGSGTGTYADGTGTGASFNAPRGVTTDGTSVFVADAANNRIRRIIIASGAVSTLAGSGTATFADGVGTGASFNNPFALTVDGDNVFVADTGNHRIRMIQVSTGTVTTVAGSGTATFADGTGAGASFSSPSGITTDGTNLFIADANNHRIRQIAIASGAVTTLAGNGSAAWADGAGTGAAFNGPNQIIVDRNFVYVGDTINSVIRRIAISTGVVVSLAGKGSSGFADGTGSAAFFDFPRGITSNGLDLFIVDNGNHRLRRIR